MPSARWPAVKQLVALFNEQPVLEAIQTLTTNPGDTIEADTLWIAGTETADGPEELPELGSPTPITLHDTFTVVVRIQTVGHSDTGDAWDRLSDLCNAVVLTLRSYPNLDGLTFVLWAQIASERELVEDTRDGARGRAQFEITVDTEIPGGTP